MRYFLLGTTASGKTAVSVELARMLDAEILSMDSMLVYQRMDIGTAKPTEQERGGIPHHLLDLLSPAEEYSVTRYLEEAARIEAQLTARGINSLYVGGTGLYFKGLIFGMFEGPEIPSSIRRQVEYQLANGEYEQLRTELESVDPRLAERLHPHDQKRLVRGIETWRATGQALSDWQLQWDGHREIHEPAVALEWERSEAHARVEQRFHQMLDDGLLEEIKTILADGGFGRSARQAIGYRQMLAHLEDGVPLEEAIAAAVTATRRLIRRQTTWLGNFPGVARISRHAGDSSAQVAEGVANIFIGKSNKNPTHK